MTNVIEIEKGPIPFIQAALKVIANSDKHQGRFITKLLIGFKRFYDQGYIAPGIDLPESFIEAFDNLREHDYRFDDHIDRLGSIIMGMGVTTLDLHNTLQRRSKSLNLSHLETFIDSLFSSNLSDESLKSINADYEGVLSWLDRGYSRYRELIRQHSYKLIPLNITLLMLQLSKLREHDKVYLPHDCSKSFIRAISRNTLANDIILPKDLKLTIQTPNAELMEMEELDLLIRGLVNQQYVNSSPLLNPVLEPREGLSITGSSPEEIIEDKKKDTLLKFDKVIACPPFGESLDKEFIKQDRFSRFPKGLDKLKDLDYAHLYNLLAHTNDDGRIVLLTYQGPLIRYLEEEYRKDLLDRDLVEAVINLPAQSVDYTFRNPIILILNKAKERAKRGLVQFIDAQNILAHNDLENETDELLQYDQFIGIAETTKLFEQFTQQDNVSIIVAKDKIEQLNFKLRPTDYVDDSNEARYLRSLLSEHNNYNLRRLGDENVSLEIKKLKKGDDIKDNHNCLYMPSIANMKPITDIRGRLETSKTKIDRYYQVELNPNVVLAEFAEYFFNTDLGKALFNTTGEGVTIQHINIERLKNCKLATPPIDVQRSILETYSKLGKLSELIEEYKKNVALNPLSAGKISNKLDDMISSVSRLSDEDIVRALVRGGENKRVEFKQTFEINVNTGKKDKDVTYSSIKTVAAFLNSEGGDLLIGVSDNQEIIGIEEEIKLHKKGIDGFLLHFKNFLNTRIGAQYYSFIDQRIIYIKDKPILRIRCESARSKKIGPIYVDEESCFVRTNPATDELKGKRLEDFLKLYSSDSGVPG